MLSLYVIDGVCAEACVHASLQPHPKACAKLHAPAHACADAQVGIKRRYNNVLVDADKQQQIEMFLGMKQDSFFPSLKLLYKVRRPSKRDSVGRAP